MTSPLKGNPFSPGKRNRSKGDDDMGSKKFKTDVMAMMGDASILNRQRIYNIASRKKPAELFRKDLISAMKLPDSDQLNPDEYLQITDTWKEEWEKGVQVPVNPDALPDGSQVRELSPQLQFRPKKQQTKDSPSSSSNSPTSSNDPSQFKMPKKLLEFESERDAIACRYEIDLTDHCWIQTIRESEDAISIPEDMLEEVMNELEHQCAQNMKAKHVGIEFDDHIVCDICRSPDAEDGNEMVFCDLCNICVHQACYGIPEIPDGEWLCTPCKEFGSQARKKVSCVFCPNSGGAFKPTSKGRWAHVSCALWIPEVSFGCVALMEPITKIKAIPSSRWNLVCSFCGVKQGAPIQCSEKTCKVAYHVTCAFNNHLKLKAIVEGESRGVKLKSFCKKHSKLNNLKDYERNSSSGSESSSNHLAGQKEHEIEIATASNSDSDKNNRFWMYIDINEINQLLIPKFKKEYPSHSTATLQLYIDIILQYWKMKRTSNYGMPLIKVITQDTIEEIQMAHRNDILRLRVNLERIRNLSYMICRREKIKRNWLTTHEEIVEQSLSLASGLDLASIVNEDEESEPLEAKLSTSHSNLSFYATKYDRVAPEEIMLARNVIMSNNIYHQDSESDKIRTKRAIKELSRIAKINDLRRRDPLPNPYERKYSKSFKRTPSNSGASDISDDRHRDIALDIHISNKIPLNGPRKINGSSILITSPSKKKRHQNNSGKSPLSPTKRPVSENLIHQKATSILQKSSKLKMRNKHNRSTSPRSLLKEKGVLSRRSSSHSPSSHSSSLKKKKRQGRDSSINGVISSDELDDQRQACCVS